LDTGKREFWWVVPFLSDDTQPYLFYSRRYDAEIGLLLIQSGHAVNIALSENKEIRNITGSEKRKHDATARLNLKQAIQTTFINESLELFMNNRDSYFGSGGEVDGYKVRITVRKLVSSSELSAGGSYRQAQSAQEERSEIFSLRFGTRMQVVKKGELRTSLEVYRQTLTNVSGVPSFQLTDNKPGRRGAVWSTDLRYGIKGGIRVNFSLSGRHSDDRTARITGRGEMVVGF